MRRVTGILFLGLLVALRTAVADPQAFALRLSATANGPWLTLGDVLDPKPPAELAEIKIRRLDSPGMHFQIGRDFVALKMKESSLSDTASVTGNVCEVTASSRILKGSEIQAFGESYLRERLAALSLSAQVVVTAKQGAKDLKVPDRSVRLEIPSNTEARWRGDVLLRIVAHQTAEDASDVEVGQSLISYLVAVHQKLMVALRPLHSGELIDETNAGIDDVDATYLPEDGYDSLTPALGLKVKGFIPADKVILPGMLERPPLIKRGDIVKVIVVSGMIRVEASAEAMRDGALGDSIPVQVQDSHKELQGRVIDEGTVMAKSE